MADGDIAFGADDSLVHDAAAAVIALVDAR
jgi:hypothetical protein